MFDTPGHDTDDSKKTRNRICKKADAVILCFAVDTLADLDEDVEKWVAGIRGANDAIPIVVALTKRDLLEEEESPKIFTEARIKKIRSDHDLQSHQFTSSKDPNAESVTKAFETAIMQACRYKFGREEGGPQTTQD